VAVRTLSEMIAQVKDEQSYIVVRERTHRNTAESSNSRVKYWGIFQIFVLIGQGFFQVWWLKRFFEVCCAPFGTISSLTDIIGQACRVGRACVSFLLPAPWLMFPPLFVLMRSCITLYFGVQAWLLRPAHWHGVGGSFGCMINERAF
jgi:hypothetical protein